jgi:hypothetical protein
MRPDVKTVRAAVAQALWMPHPGHAANDRRAHAAGKRITVQHRRPPPDGEKAAICRFSTKKQNSSLK